MSFRENWKAREMGVAEREFRRRERIAHQRRVEACLAWWREQLPKPAAEHHDPADAP